MYIISYFGRILLCNSNSDVDDWYTTYSQHSKDLLFYGAYNLSRSDMFLLYYIESYKLRSVIFNDMTELSVTI